MKIKGFKILYRFYHRYYNIYNVSCKKKIKIPVLSNFYLDETNTIINPCQ